MADLQRWRASQSAGAPDMGVFLARLKQELENYLRSGDHRLVGLSDNAAKLLYGALHEYIVGRLTPENRAPE